MKYFIWIVIIVVAVAVVAGFFIVGSPQTERLRRFDERRVQDLQILQSEIINYWSLKRNLPQTLDMLKDDIRGFVPPVDPESGASYEYLETGTLSFQLCATFNLSSDSPGDSIPKPVSGPYYEEENWAHSAGRMCFPRTIDPDLYPRAIKRSL